jgi:hypothetical protein
LPPFRNEGFNGVLLTANQMSFEKATRSTQPESPKLALVYASGFKGSAARLRNPEAVTLYFPHQGELGGTRADYFGIWLFTS